MSANAHYYTKVLTVIFLSLGLVLNIFSLSSSNLTSPNQAFAADDCYDSEGNYICNDMSDGSNSDSDSDDSGGDSGSDDSGGDSGSDDSGGDSGSDDSGGDSGSDDSGGDSGSDDSGGDSGSDDSGGDSGSDDRVETPVVMIGYHM